MPVAEIHDGNGGAEHAILQSAPLSHDRKPWRLVLQGHQRTPAQRGGRGDVGQRDRPLGGDRALKPAANHQVERLRRAGPHPVRRQALNGHVAGAYDRIGPQRPCRHHDGAHRGEPARDALAEWRHALRQHQHGRGEAMRARVIGRPLHHQPRLRRCFRQEGRGEADQLDLQVRPCAERLQFRQQRLGHRFALQGAARALHHRSAGGPRAGASRARNRGRERELRRFQQPALARAGAAPSGCAARGPAFSNRSPRVTTGPASRTCGRSATGWAATGAAPSSAAARMRQRGRIMVNACGTGSRASRRSR